MRTLTGCSTVNSFVHFGIELAQLCIKCKGIELVQILSVDFFGQCLSECFENCDMQQFHLVLLLRRQASLEGTHISPSYSTWFEVGHDLFYTHVVFLCMYHAKQLTFFLFEIIANIYYERIVPWPQHEERNSFLFQKSY